MDQVNHPVRQIAGKKGAVVGATVFAQPAGHKHLRVPVRQGQFDVGVSLVVAQQDVETGLALLDQVVFKRQGLVFVFHQDVIHVHRFAHQRAGFGVGLGSVQQVRPHPGAKVLGFAHVDYFALCIAIQIHPGPSGQGAHLFVQIHG